MKKWKWMVLLDLLLLAACVNCIACSKEEQSADVVDISSMGQRGGNTMKQGNTDRTELSIGEQGGVIGRVESIVGNEATMTLLENGEAVTYIETGEVGIFLIPVGMSVGSGDYSSISAGMILRLNIQDDTVMSVRILKKAS